MADPDSGVIFRRRNLSRGRCREDLKRGRDTGNVSARGHSDTVVSLAVLLAVLYYTHTHTFTSGTKTLMTNALSYSVKEISINKYQRNKIVQ